MVSHIHPLGSVNSGNTSPPTSKSPPALDEAMQAAAPAENVQDERHADTTPSCTEQQESLSQDTTTSQPVRSPLRDGMRGVREIGSALWNQAFLSGIPTTPSMAPRSLVPPHKSADNHTAGSSRHERIERGKSESVTAAATAEVEARARRRLAEAAQERLSCDAQQRHLGAHGERTDSRGESIAPAGINHTADEGKSSENGLDSNPFVRGSYCR